MPERQEYDFLHKLVSAPGFAERVNGIVVEFGNAGYQDKPPTFCRRPMPPRRRPCRSFHRRTRNSRVPLAEMLSPATPGAAHTSIELSPDMFLWNRSGATPCLSN